MFRLFMFAIILGITMSASGQDRSLASIIQAIKADLPFDVSPRYVNFRPSDKLRAEIERYCSDANDGKLLNLEKALWESENAYVAIGLINIIAKLQNPHAPEVLQRYKRYLNAEKELFATGYPDRKAVVTSLTAIESAKTEKSK